MALRFPSQQRIAATRRPAIISTGTPALRKVKKQIPEKHTKASPSASRRSCALSSPLSHHNFPLSARFPNISASAAAVEEEAAPEGMAESSKSEQKPSPEVSKRRILLILHGKRIYDEQIREDVKAIQEEGHDVSEGP